MPRFDTNSRRRRTALFASVLAALIAGIPARAQDASREADRLKQIERALETDRGRVEALEKQATTLAAEVTDLQAKMVEAAAAVQNHEGELSQLETLLRQLEEKVSDRRAALGNRRELLAQTLAALQRLSLQPPEALVLGPDSPLDTVRSAMLLRVAIPALKTQAAALQGEVDELRSLGEETARRREELADTAARLDADRARIATLIERKRALQQTTTAERRAAEERMAALARQAEDLRDLLARVRTPQVAVLPPPKPDPSQSTPGRAEPTATIRLPEPDNIRNFPATPASLTPPARGNIVTRFGESSAVGLYSKGIAIATREQAQVVAPFDGQVVFRGPFRGYGEILIIEHRGGYHSLLVGLGRTDAAVGQWLLAGEPVGIMGPAGDGAPELYLELRHGGEPTDPLPWLKSRDSEATARE